MGSLLMHAFALITHFLLFFSFHLSHFLFAILPLLFHYAHLWPFIQSAVTGFTIFTL